MRARAIASLAAAAATLALAFVPGAEPAFGSGVDDEREVLPVLAGSSPIHLDGEISVDGRRLFTSVLRTSASPSEVMSFYRANYEPLPVDLAEAAMENGRVLSIWDVHAERRIVISARALPGGETEVIRSWSPMTGVEHARRDSPFPPLPDDLRELSRIDDRIGGSATTSWTGASARGLDEIDLDLRRRFRGAGWIEGPMEVQDLFDSKVVRFHRDGRILVLTLGRLSESATLVTLQFVETSET